MSDRIEDLTSSSSFDISTNGGKEKGSSGWFCIHCRKRHFASGECPEALFGAGDEWCELCQRVHYDYAKCPKSSLDKV